MKEKVLRLKIIILLAANMWIYGTNDDQQQSYESHKPFSHADYDIGGLESW